MSSSGKGGGNLPLRSALKTDDDGDKTPPASGTLKGTFAFSFQSVHLVCSQAVLQGLVQVRLSDAPSSIMPTVASVF